MLNVDHYSLSHSAPPTADLILFRSVEILLAAEGLGKLAPEVVELEVEI